jgi:hypothetical protein
MSIIYEAKLKNMIIQKILDNNYSSAKMKKKINFSRKARMNYRFDLRLRRIHF